MIRSGDKNRCRYALSCALIAGVCCVAMIPSIGVMAADAPGVSCTPPVIVSGGSVGAGLAIIPDGGTTAIVLGMALAVVGLLGKMRRVFRRGRILPVPDSPVPPLVSKKDCPIKQSTRGEL